MRAKTSSPTPSKSSESPKDCVSQSGVYIVPPLFVNDFATQCAAHFLVWFATNSIGHARDVLKCGMHKAGGLVEEVEYWMQQCAADAQPSGGNLEYWDTSTNGPWIYEGLSPAVVAKMVKRHTRGWAAKEFLYYGYTVAEKAKLDDVILKF